MSKNRLSKKEIASVLCTIVVGATVLTGSKITLTALTDMAEETVMNKNNNKTQQSQIQASNDNKKESKPQQEDKKEEAQPQKKELKIKSWEDLVTWINARYEIASNVFANTAVETYTLPNKTAILVNNDVSVKEDLELSKDAGWFIYKDVFSEGHVFEALEISAQFYFSDKNSLRDDPYIKSMYNTVKTYANYEGDYNEFLTTLESLMDKVINSPNSSSKDFRDTGAINFFITAKRDDMVTTISLEMLNSKRVYFEEASVDTDENLIEVSSVAKFRNEDDLQELKEKFEEKLYQKAIEYFGNDEIYSCNVTSGESGNQDKFYYSFGLWIKEHEETEGLDKMEIIKLIDKKYKTIIGILYDAINEVAYNGNTKINRDNFVSNVFSYYMLSRFTPYDNQYIDIPAWVDMSSNYISISLPVIAEGLRSLN